MSAQGFEKSMDRGDRRSVRNEERIEAERLARPEAFSMMDLEAGS